MQIAPRTIYSKGLMLISIPLVLQLAFGIAMFSLQRYYEEKINQERVASEIVFHANEMWINCAEVMLLRAYFNLFGGPEPPVEERLSRISEEYNLVRKLVANDQTQMKNLETIQSTSYKLVDLTNRYRPLLPKDQSRSARIAVLQSNLDTFVETDRMVGVLSAAMQKFSEPEFFHSPAAAAEVEKATTIVDAVVIGALSCSTLVAISLFIYFVRGINRKLKVMVENTEKFKRGDPLHFPLAATDELTEVDAAFHDMATEIREAQAVKQRVLAMISHDLRTPLGSVLGYFSLLTSGALRDASRDAISGAENQERKMEHLMRLICDLLDLEKMEAEKLRLRTRIFSVGEVMEKAIEAVEPLSDWRGVLVEGAASSQELCADPDRIVQVLTNLFSCAIRLSPGGSTIDASVVQQNGDVEIRISSPRASVSGDVLNAQFDRYQPREAGLGLELPVSKEIIKLHNGIIGATSDQPQGCTLWFRLPAAQAS